MMDDSKQIIANLQAENARLQARIAELEQENFAEYTEFYEHENIWKLHQFCVLDQIKSLIDTIERIAPNYMFDNAKLKARITELESELNQATATPANDDIELTGASKKAVTRLLYALLREHNYSIDGTTKGATNHALENLTTRHDVGISRQTIANWLAEINTLHYNKNK